MRFNPFENLGNGQENQEKVESNIKKLDKEEGILENKYPKSKYIAMLKASTAMAIEKARKEIE